MFVGVNSEFGQIVKMSRVCSRVQRAEEAVFIFPKPCALRLHMVTHQWSELKIVVSRPVAYLAYFFRG